LERSIASYEATFGPEHAMIYWYSSNLGWSLLAQGYPSAGLIALQRALQGRRKSLGERHPETLHSALALGSAHICVGDHREALLQMSNLAAAEEADVNTRVQALRLSGVAAIGLGRLEEAERRLREALSNLDDREGEHDLTRALILGQLARAQWLAGKASAARVTLKAAFELVEHNDPQLRDVLDLYVTMGQVHWNRDWQYARQYLDAAIAAATIEEPDSCHLVDATQWFTAGVESVKTR
jgi:tetratricopeptide (TPR) repeat protein